MRRRARARRAAWRLPRLASLAVGVPGASTDARVDAGCDMPPEHKLLLPQTIVATEDPIGDAGGSVVHCHHDVLVCCLGYWCPCWLFGRNLQQAGICRNTASGCALYSLVSGLIAFTVASLSSRSLATFVECLSTAEENVYEPCLLAVAGPGGQPDCTREDIYMLAVLEQMHAVGNVPQSIIAAKAEAVGVQCLQCVSKLDRLSEQQQQIMAERVAESALLCNDREHSRSRLVELFALVAMGMFGGLCRELIQSTILLGAGTGHLRCGLPTWRSFGLHCCPLTHQLALCQESRAVAAANARLVAPRKHAGD